MKLRVLKVGEKYMPQIKRSFFSRWEALSRHSRLTWNGWGQSLQYCLYDSFDDAKAAFDTHSPKAAFDDYGVKVEVVWEDETA